MRKLWWAALCAAGVMASSATARADSFSFDISGLITSQLAPGVDANISVGDTVHVVAQVDASRVVPFGTSGQQVAFIDRHSPSGTVFDVTLNSLYWANGSDIYDGGTMFDRYTHVLNADGTITNSLESFGAPAIIFEGDRVEGLIGFLDIANSSAAPILQMGTPRIYASEYIYNEYAGGPLLYREPGGPIPTTLNFTITAGNGLYFNNYESPGFAGVWSGSVSGPGIGAAAPEPNAWALLIGGFGLTGATLRRRRRSFLGQGDLR